MNKEIIHDLENRQYADMDGTSKCVFIEFFFIHFFFCILRQQRMRFSLTCFALAVRFLCAFSIICSLDGYCRHVVDVRVEPIHHCNFRQFHFCFSTSMLLIALALALSLLCVCVCVSLVTIEIKSPQHSVVGFAFFSQCKLMSCGQCFEFLHGTDLFSVVHQTVHQVILNQIKKNPQQQQ